MQQELLPLFPLKVVLLPNAQLALHIFEERYKEMIGEAIANNSEFGIVLASEKGIVNTGCTAIVRKVVRKYDDGRMDIIAAGRRRFEILTLDDEKHYLRGEVQFFDDEDSRAPSGEATAKVEAVFEQLKNAGPAGEFEMTAPDAPFSFHVAHSVPDLNLRQILLTMRSEADRIQRLAEYLPAIVERMRVVEQVKAAAPTNGHGRHSNF